MTHACPRTRLGLPTTLLFAGGSHVGSHVHGFRNRSASGAPLGLSGLGKHPRWYGLPVWSGRGFHFEGFLRPQHFYEDLVVLKQGDYGVGVTGALLDDIPFRLPG